jgi:DNA-binding response OmpR family regulator
LRPVSAEFTVKDGEPRTCLAATRNISRDGLSLLLGWFVYPGTPCRLQLISVRGLTFPVSGKVVRCRYLPGSAVLHEVGIAFDEPVDVGQLCRRAVEHNVLLLSDDTFRPELLRHMLRPRRAEVTHVENAAAALATAAEADFDYVLIDLDLPDAGGPDTIRALREHGYQRPIVALTSVTDAEYRQRCLDAGCSHFLIKPLARQQLTAVLDATAARPLSADLPSDPGLTQAVSHFVAELPTQVAALELALHHRDLTVLLSGVRLLKERAGACRFDSLTAVAAVLETSLERQSPVERLQRELEELARWCRAARPSAEGAN